MTASISLKRASLVDVVNAPPALLPLRFVPGELSQAARDQWRPAVASDVQCREVRLHIDHGALRMSRERLPTPSWR